MEGFQPIIDGLPLIRQGLAITFIASIFGSVLAVVVGFTLGLATLLRQPLLRRAIRAYVYFFRGTPSLVLLFLIFFGLPMMGLTLPALQAGIVALGLQSSAYVLEVVRAALEGVSSDQYEAAALDGAGQWTTLYRVILPQSVRQMVPGVVNELIGLIKGTSLLSVISVGDVMRSVQLINARHFIPFEAYGTLAIIYLVIIAVVTRCSVILERYLDRVVFRGAD
jgi:polar amino acid transport system permease protein